MFALRNLPPVGDILENLVDSMAEMGVAVGVGWTIMENKLLQWAKMEFLKLRLLSSHHWPQISHLGGNCKLGEQCRCIVIEIESMTKKIISGIDLYYCYPKTYSKTFKFSHFARREVKSLAEMFLSSKNLASTEEI